MSKLTLIKKDAYEASYVCTTHTYDVSVSIYQRDTSIRLYNRKTKAIKVKLVKSIDLESEFDDELCELILTLM